MDRREALKVAGATLVAGATATAARAKDNQSDSPAATPLGKAFVLKVAPQSNELSKEQADAIQAKLREAIPGAVLVVWTSRLCPEFIARPAVCGTFPQRRAENKRRGRTNGHRLPLPEVQRGHKAPAD